ncbi:hypothetical protein N7468_001548 [Penicillium chermesinum]|uniref:FAD-binding domain-containing protein n=1 Tax=Penicillium chermesinum TaxID=63820 RepID=A0A9W9TWV3_9EURO|nr:uncharacterized protein N7468_001548 [Penicillium chermesinum]KAJ5246565.1 hypothetical protein N7468_001548 [Penicillium chermesinum]KAJ6144833.1 hypothetical protein N7470_008728 [Penicillium chermesinum]
MPSRKAIILGAGPAGLAAALRLQQQTDIECTIYELRSTPTTLGGAVGIPSNGQRLLHRLGVWDQAHSRGFSGSNLTMHSLSGSIVASSDFVGWARERTGFGYMRIKRTDIVDVLLDAVQKAGIPVQFGKKLSALSESESGVSATFDDGEVVQADLLLGCDGIHSFVRSKYVDPGYAPVYSGISTLGSVIPASVLSAETLAQLNGLESTMTEKGMLAVNPCTAGKEEVFMFFSKFLQLPEAGDSRDGWTAHGKEEVESYRSDLRKMVEHAKGTWGDALRELAHGVSDVHFYPIYRLPLGGKWSRGRVVLVGDAAHAMSPHAGQGVSMALEDVFLLARLLKDPARPLDEAFEKYDAIRRPRVDEIFTMAANNARNRKATGTWGLWFKELAISMFMNVSWALGLDRSGKGQHHLVYDIDEAEI